MADQPKLMFESEAISEEGAFYLYHVRGREGLSQLYELELEVASHVDVLTQEDIDGLLTKPAHVRDTITGVARHGMVQAVEMLPYEASLHDTSGPASLPRYRLRLVPRAWGLTQTVRSRAFYQKKLDEIVQLLLKDAGLEAGTDFELQLTKTYVATALTIQYEESDWDFLCRLLERDGIAFVFDHAGDVEKMVVTDGANAWVALPDPFLYRPVSGMVPDLAVAEMTLRQQAVPRAVWVRDYNETKPATLVQSSKAPIDDAGWPAGRVGSGAQVYFGEHTPDASDAGRLAKLRAEEHLAQKLVAFGRTGAFDVAPGAKLTVEGHLDARFNVEWLVTAVEHAAQQGGIAESGGAETSGYGNSFEAIPASAVYRPPRLTPWPRIPGLVTGHVKGAGDKTGAPLDAKADYAIVLHFDSTAALGMTDAETVRVRMAQNYSGVHYGTHLPLHEGAEVLVAFVNGDPDRPIIVATVPNAETVSPGSSTMLTRSTIVSRSDVKIEIDDDA